ncbi:hypothetical protein BJ992_006264 [Sphaerisporangium rubeum]|uniref:Uncharacterized protein n=1 Tax=Sphaerisporangium rubeum TaxID=321317 RepID=A0A7X0IMN7_9ACTN|nr:hypothetical protein [Sphaerisporangium rubeum]
MTPPAHGAATHRIAGTGSRADLVAGSRADLVAGPVTRTRIGGGVAGSGVSW